jgi:hypothetical protein
MQNVWQLGVIRCVQQIALLKESRMVSGSTAPGSKTEDGVSNRPLKRAA